MPAAFPKWDDDQKVPLKAPAQTKTSKPTNAKAWSTRLVVTASGFAFVAGLFVAWIVFSRPAQADPVVTIPNNDAALLSRIVSLEQRLEAQQTLLVADEILAKNLVIADTNQGRGRIVLSMKNGHPLLVLMRDGKKMALALSEKEGQTELTLYDTADQPRVSLLTGAKGDSMVRILDATGQPRIGLVSVASGDSQVMVFDKFGNAKALE